MTWSIQTVVSLGAVAKVFIAIVVAVLAYLVYKASKKGANRPDVIVSRPKSPLVPPASRKAI